MPKYKDKTGFGIIELLIALIIITFLTITVTRVMRENIGVATGKSKNNIRAAFEKALSKRKNSRIIEAGRDYLGFISDKYEGNIRLSGNPPYGVLELFDGTKSSVIDSNISFVHFTYYDRKHNLIFDEDASRYPSKIRRIKVSIYRHSGTEDRGFVFSDGIKGIDLDGDTSNGTARLSNIEFLVDLKK